MRIPRSVSIYAPPVLLAGLTVYGLHHLWYRAFGMWAAGMRPLFVSAKRAAEMSPDGLGLWFGLEFLLLAAVLVPVFLYGGERLRRALPALMAGALVVSQIVSPRSRGRTSPGRSRGASTTRPSSSACTRFARRSSRSAARARGGTPAQSTGSA